MLFRSTGKTAEVPSAIKVYVLVLLKAGVRELGETTTAMVPEQCQDSTRKEKSNAHAEASEIMAR